MRTNETDCVVKAGLKNPGAVGTRPRTQDFRVARVFVFHDRVELRCGVQGFADSDAFRAGAARLLTQAGVLLDRFCNAPAAYSPARGRVVLQGRAILAVSGTPRTLTQRGLGVFRKARRF